MGAVRFLCKTLPEVATEKALSVLAYNLTRSLPRLPMVLWRVIGITSACRDRGPEPHL